MAVILNASTSSGLVQTADTSGDLELQSNGTTKLTVNASGVTIPTLSSTSITGTTVQGTIVQGTAVASTSGTSIDFTGIPSWVKRITVMFSLVSTDGTNPYLIQLGDSEGIETTGYSSLCASDRGTESTATNGFLYTGSSVTSTTILSGAMTITQISGNTYIYSVVCADPSGANIRSYGGGGSKTLSDVLTQVRITTTTGTDTFDAGSINILYE